MAMRKEKNSVTRLRRHGAPAFLVARKPAARVIPCSTLRRTMRMEKQHHPLCGLRHFGDRILGLRFLRSLTRG